MSTWLDFRDQAIEDWKSSILLQNGNKIGNSAYMLQQSLEKFVKAMIMKYEISKYEPEKLTHLPLNKLWEELQSGIKNQIDKTNNVTSKATYDLMEKSVKIIEKFFRQATNSYKEIIWKESLEIKLEQDEQKELLNLVSNLKQELGPVIKKVVFDYKNLFDNELKPFIKNMPKKYKIELQQTLDELELEINIDDIGDKTMDTSTDISDLIKETPKFFDSIEKLYYVIKKDPRKRYFLDTEQFLTILLAWIFQFSDVILKTFVHEEIGRYPRKINDKSSRMWYKEKSDAIEHLRTKVPEACSRLFFITSNQPIFGYSSK